MNVSVLIVFAACGICAVWCETCTTDVDCSNTQCGAGSEILCQHPSGDGVVTDGGLCTCGDVKGECIAASDCYGDNAPNLNCADGSRHCYDGKCICDRFPVGKRAIFH